MNLLKALNEIRLNKGVTYNLKTGEINPDSGFMVSLEGGIKSTYIDEALLKVFVNSYATELSKDNRYIGVWHDGSVYHLDVSILYEDIDQALEVAKVNNQKAIWSNFEKDEIWV